jgi:hypothetical protein
MLLYALYKIKKAWDMEKLMTVSKLGYLQMITNMNA